MRGRHAAELTHQLKRAALARLAREGRAFRDLRGRLEAQDLRRRFAASRGRLTTADQRLNAAALRARERADTRLPNSRRPVEHAEPARGTRPRLRRLLERGSHSHHSRCIVGPARRTRPRDAAARRSRV